MYEAITIKDIGKALGLSTSTVSRALRGSYEISSETKKLVLEYAEKINYRPNPVALSLKGRRNCSIGVIVSEIANNFFSQEPGSNETIEEFCKKNYGVSFPMAAKISVKGKDMAPIYQWLCNKSENGVMDSKVTWNFNKFLLDENGKLVAHFKSTVKPMSTEITGKL